MGVCGVRPMVNCGALAVVVGGGSLAPAAGVWRTLGSLHGWDVPWPGHVGYLVGGSLAWLLQPLCSLAPSTILVEPGCQAEVTETGDIRISVGAETASMVGAQLDPIHLSIFSHRFMSIAGEWLHSPAPPPAPCSAGWGSARQAVCAGVPGRGVQGESAIGGRAEAEPLSGGAGSVAPALGWTCCTSRSGAGGSFSPPSTV